MTGTLGKYRIDGVLGKGAMGLVYKGFDPQIERTVALKTIRKELFGEAQQAELVGRFRNEAQAAGRLNHPNIVTVYDYGEDSDTAYIAMEFVEGAPLASLLMPGRPAAPAQALGWMRDLLLALDYAHSRGVVHRDIKPANLLVTHAGQVKVSDFGVARIDTSTLTHTGSMIGTPSFMSPEQLRGETVDGRSDVFSAGIVLYQLLTGMRPFAGSATVVMQQILNVAPPPPSQHLPALGSAYDQVAGRALAKEPGQRYPSARAFLDALEAAARGDAGAPPDDDRTVLAPGPRFVPAAPDPGTGGVSLAGDTVTPWKVEALPELETLLAHQLGPMARVLLRKLAPAAGGLDELCDLLAPHVPAGPGRNRFEDGVAALKRRLDASGTGAGRERPRTFAASATGRTTGGAPAPLDDAFVERTAQRLTPLIGPIAPMLARRAARQAADRSEFLALLGAHIASPEQRARFLAEATLP